MDATPLTEYHVDLPITQLNTDQYFTASVTAVERMGWRIVSCDKPIILCHTPGSQTSQGESVTITIGISSAIFHSRSVDNVDLTDDQNAANAELFITSLNNVVETYSQAEKDLKFLDKGKLIALVPSRTYLVTPLLIYANVLIFVLMVCRGVGPLTPETSDLLNWGGNIRPFVVEGEWWRLFTYMFLHAGVFHLLMNMFALLYIGIFLEPLLGKTRFLSAYLLTGVCAGLASIIMHSFTVAVGASGAIFGMYGVFVAMLTTRFIERTARKTILRSILYFIIFNLANGVKGNIDNAAHIGGLISGLAVGYAFYPGLLSGQRIIRQLGVSAIITIAVILLALISIHNLNDDFQVYQQKIAKFSTQESMALEVYKMREDAPKADILYNLKDRGIYYWNENLTLLKEMDQLDIPDALKEQDKKLRRYCDLRISLYQLLYRRLNENDSSLSDQINKKGQEVEDLMKDIKQTK